MKQVLKSTLALLGIGVHRVYRKSKNTNRLSFYKTKTGNYWLPRDAHSDCVANCIKEDKIFEESVYLTAKKYIKEGSIVLDIGANFGQMSILFSKLVGPKGQVISFDANGFVYSILKKNAIENANNIYPVFAAVHDKSNETLYFQEQDFERFDAYGSYGIDYVNNKGKPVKTLKIDDLDFKKPISFIKIDIQGGDLLAMKGAAETIKKHQCPVLFEYEVAFEDELGLCFQEYVDFVASIGYRFEKMAEGHNFLILPK